MQMERYESLILTIPEITNDESSEIEKLLDKKIQTFKGKLITYDRWGKYQLAYPVKGKEYGVYYLARFEIPATKKSEILKEVKSLLDLKFNEIVMRHLISQLDINASLEYKRPTSLEETPKDIDQFLKENRMTGIAPRRGEGEEQRMTQPRERAESAPVRTFERTAEKQPKKEIVEAPEIAEEE